MSVRDFFKGKSIFITGGSGFVGKVLIEKLLRSCDGIEKIYVLLREKKGKSPSERINLLVDCPLFDLLKEKNSAAIEKLIPISGDVSKIDLGDPKPLEKWNYDVTVEAIEKLFSREDPYTGGAHFEHMSVCVSVRDGLTKEDIRILTENIDIIYHASASVRFDDHLKDSIILNARGTREVVNIALQAKKIVTFIHISTAYCNCDRKFVDEKLYFPHADWKDAIRIAEELDQHSLNVFSTKYISPLPNTYVFAKSLAEHIVNDLCKGRIPAAIVRPSVVVSTAQDPIVGWIDNLKGPMGLLLAGGKGVLKVCYGDKNVMTDYIPADILIKMIILSTYEQGTKGNVEEVSVYNASTYGNFEVRNGDLVAEGTNLVWDTPSSELLWYPSFTMTNIWLNYYVYFLLYHMLPALITDAFLKILGKPSMIVRLQRKIYIANMALIFFMRNTWKFVNHKAMSLDNYVQESESNMFSICDIFNVSPDEIHAFYANGKIQAERFLFKTEFNREKGFRITLFFWVLDRLLQISVFGLLAWYIISNINITTYFQ